MLVVRAAAMHVATPSSPLGERGVLFQPGGSFYRPQSIFSRDLACLSGLLHRQEHGTLSVLDLMAGSGVRAMRYLQHAKASSVWANDVSAATHEALAANLSAALGEAGLQEAQPGAPVATQLPLMDQQAWGWQQPGSPPGSEPAVCITHEEGARLLSWFALRRQHFDLIDIDSFGSEASFVGGALGAMRYGGLLCLTSTAGPVAGGRDPVSALSQYGMRLAPVPFANEQGLRMLLGVACREALARNLVIKPLWSLYSAHGPVFRIMLRVDRGRGRKDITALQRQQGFLLHDGASGEVQVMGWDNLGAELMSRPGSPGGPQPSLSGPLWVGPLQDGAHLAQLQALAEAAGWLGRDSCAECLPFTKKGGVRSLGELLALLQGEADPRLPPWHFLLTDVSAVGRLQRPPGLGALLAALRARGYAAAATHINFSGLRTDASMAEVVRVCIEDLGIPVSGAAASP